MKKMIATAMVAGFMAAAASAEKSAEVSTTLDLASAYVFRGVTYNDGPVFQPGIEASGLGLPEEMGSLSVGVWGNYDLDDYDGNVNSSELSELDFYVSYTLPTIVEGVDFSLAYWDYTYPGAAEESDKEVSLSVGYGIGDVSVGVGYYVLTDSSEQDPYADISLGYEMALTDEVDASFGARAGFIESEFSDYDLSAGLSYALNDVWSIGASAAYIGQGDEDVLADTVYGPGGVIVGDPGYDVDFVGMLSLSASF